MTYLEASATVSPCGLYRYDLRRVWDFDRRPCLFVMLNPSTADGDSDDPTIRKCVGFAERAGAGGLVVVNLFAFRATKPKDMFAATDPVGPDNDAWIKRQVGKSQMVVVAWGANVTKSNRPVIRDRPFAVRKMLAEMGAGAKCLGVTGCGNPWHPLMVGYDVPLTDFQPAAAGT